MTTHLRTLVAASLLAATAIVAADPTQKEAAECRARGGLPNVMAKLRGGKDVAVGFLGGSITAAPGYRPKIMAWLQKEFPTAKLREINAAIGGTGSDLGAFRVGQDVLQHKPDLLFVEFAVNDGSAAPEQIHRTMEGIVRQTWRNDANTDIAFVYTFSEPMLADLRAGRLSRSASAMEDVADHYAIPTVCMGLEAARMEKEGKLIFKAADPKTDAEKAAVGDRMIFSSDGVHPHPETGHELYTKALARSLTAIKDVGQAVPHALKEPLDAMNWEKAKIVQVKPAMLSGAWKSLDAGKDDMAKRFAKQLPGGLQLAATPGDTITFKFRGRQAAFYDLLGPDGGMVELTVDTKPSRKIARIDGYCTYHRLAQVGIVSENADGEHTVSAKLLSDAPDKAKLLFEHNRPDLEKNPAKYAANQWHLGAIMLIGDLVE